MPLEPGLATARALLAQWVTLGLSNAFVSPGARSTPLVLALQAAPSVRKHIVTDERSAAFAALGAARETKRPTLLVCTSGTAGANYLPAVIEASLANVPLLVVTADRPPEAQDWRAAQTINQTGLYRDFVRWSVLLPAPERAGVDPPTLAYLQATACRAWHVASDERGPVHLNLPFREPLLDDAGRDEASDLLELPSAHLQVHRGPRLVPNSVIQAFADRQRTGRRGLIVAGPECRSDDAGASIKSLAKQLDWPILADPLSGLRSGPGPGVVDAYDVLLRDPAFVEAHQPEVLLQLGVQPASKPLARFLSAPALANTERWIVAERDWPDPAHLGGNLVAATPQTFCALLGEALSQQDLASETSAAKTSSWCQEWLDQSAATRSAIDTLLAQSDPRFSGRVAQTLAAHILPGSALTVGNSMPVRDLDTWAPGLAEGVTVYANRGANGIDGVVSTALGAARSSKRPHWLYLGDQSLLHDAGALASSLCDEANLRIVVPNDNGGGIFEQLPQQRLGATFETYFAAPHHRSPSALAQAAGLESVLCADSLELDEALKACREKPGVLFFEVTTDRALDRQLRSELPQQALGAAAAR